MRARISLAAAVAAALTACGPDAGTGDRFVDRDGDGFVASVDCDDGNPYAWRLLSVYPDADRDGRGSGPASTVCAGAAAPQGWATVAGDCDDAHGDRWREATGYVDADGDGVGVGEAVAQCAGEALPAGWAAVAGDCDDGHATSWRWVQGFTDEDRDGVGAGEETVFCRGVDFAGIAAAAGDCAPADPGAWAELAYVYRDADLDGVFVYQPGFACSGAALPHGYALDAGLTGDCDDANGAIFTPVRGWPDADADGFGAGEPRDLCTAGELPERWAAAPGDCAPDDVARYQVLPYAFADGDGDTVLAAHEGSICTGASLPAGYAAAVSTVDCDDQDETRWATWAAYPDTDGDGFGAGTAQPLCIGRTRPERWSDVAGDCAPDDGQRWRELAYSYRDADLDGRTVAESGTVCSGASLPGGYSTVPIASDCDDADPLVHTSVVGYADGDTDGVGAGDAQRFCTAGELPGGYVVASGDCAPDDGAAWRLLAYAGVDADGDGWTVAATGSICSGAALPPPYLASRNGNDCDDANPLLWRWVVLYEDKDGDGVGAPPRSIPCLGEALPAGWSTLGYDADDATSAVVADDELLELVIEVL